MMDNDYRIVKLPIDTILYHGTIFNFDPDEIRTPCWFSTKESEAINHICYKHYGHPNGKLITYKVIEEIELIDISDNGDVRMYINAYGNHSLAKNIKLNKLKNIFSHLPEQSSAGRDSLSTDNKELDGYINYPEQSEVMMVNINKLKYCTNRHVDLNHRVIFKRVHINRREWKMESIGTGKRDNRRGLCGYCTVM